jgi:hypothetical protein
MPTVAAPNPRRAVGALPNASTNLMATKWAFVCDLSGLQLNYLVGVRHFSDKFGAQARWKYTRWRFSQCDGTSNVAPTDSHRSRATTSFSLGSSSSPHRSHRANTLTTS